MSGGGWETPGGPAQPGPAPWGQPPSQQETNGKAITALVLGICSFLICPVILSIPAVILGYQARGEIDRAGGSQSGRGMAVAGIVLGWISLALGVLAIIAIIVFGVIGTSVEGGDFETSTSGDPFNAITFASDALGALGALL